MGAWTSDDVEADDGRPAEDSGIGHRPAAGGGPAGRRAGQRPTDHGRVCGADGSRLSGGDLRRPCPAVRRPAGRQPACPAGRGPSGESAGGWPAGRAEGAVGEVAGRRLGERGGLGPGQQHERALGIPVAGLGGGSVRGRAARALGWRHPVSARPAAGCAVTSGDFRPFSTRGARPGSTRGPMCGRLLMVRIAGMTEPDVVTVRGLRKAYRGRVVVDDLDLDVPGGEIVGLVGANGAGKTTTVECIQGLRRPDAGTLRVLGHDPVSQAEQLRPLVGSQLQDSALPDRLRVAEALDLFATERAHRGGELLDQFGLAERRKSAFASLSGGERQRLFLVLALLNRPRLVILDELTQGLDPAARRNVWAAVRQLRAAGTTVLLVTHEMDEAEALCGRINVMRAGRIIDRGTPAELVDRYARRATVSFTMANPPAGLLDEVSRLDGVAEVQREGARVTVHGDRRMIAYVGAALVRWGPVPADLSVRVPDLEDAMLSLLGTAPADGAPALAGSEGARSPDGIEFVGGRQ